MNKQRGDLVVGIYFHPEAYPPTLNALEELSGIFTAISVVHRPHLRTAWPYPANVRTIASGRFMSEEQQMQSSLPQKFLFFLRFLRTFSRECLRTKPAVILVYDTMSLYAYHLMRSRFRFPHKLWYHNHDVVEKGRLRKYSVGWLAAEAESKAFDYLDVFSLPTSERLSYFPMDRFKGRYFLLPNFPSLKFYNAFFREHPLGETVRLIFQGQIGAGRGIELIFPLLAGSIAGKQVELALMGPCEEGYKAALMRLCEQQGVAGRVHFGRLPYRELPAFTTTCHIGLALLSDKNIMTTTMGTASNKIFEYAALGLPVLYHGETLKSTLQDYPWAVSTELDTGDILLKLTGMVQAYPSLSAAARESFNRSLNYQAGFSGIGSWIAGVAASSGNQKE